MPNQINAKDRIFHTDKGSNPRPSIYIDENNLALTTRQVIVFLQMNLWSIVNVYVTVLQEEKEKSLRKAKLGAELPPLILSDGVRYLQTARSHERSGVGGLLGHFRQTNLTRYQ